MGQKAKLDPSDLESFTATFAGIIERAHSVTEIERWLANHPSVQTATVSDYLQKSHPPQREIIVIFKSEDGRAAQKSFKMSELGPGEFRFLRPSQG